MKISSRECLFLLAISLLVSTSVFAAEHKVVSSSPEYEVTPANGVWDDEYGQTQDPLDLSFRFQVFRYEDGIGVKARVTDDKIVTDDCEPGTVTCPSWDDDNLECFFDGNNDKSKDARSDGGLYHGGEYTFVANGAAQSDFSRFPKSFGDKWTGTVTTNKLANGSYELCYDMFFDWKCLGINETPKKYETVCFGFNICVHDDDDGKRNDHALYWKGNPAIPYRDESQFGRIELPGSEKVTLASKDWTTDKEAVAAFREGALKIARRKMTEEGVKRISTGGHFTGFFLWDSVFAVLWSRHLDPNEFPYLETLDNLYAHAAEDGFIAREFAKDGKPVWSPYHPIAFAPPLLSWAELTLYREGKTDKARLTRIYPLLKRHHAACRRFRRDDGLYFGDQLGCGMDDIPRWPRGTLMKDLVPGGIPFTQESIDPSAREKIWNWIGNRAERFSWNRQCGWIDMTSQMAFDALNLAKIADVLGESVDAAAFRKEHGEIAAAVNAKCWDEEKGFYFDVTDAGIIDRYFVGAFWTLIAQIAPPDRAKKMVEKVFDPKFFGTPIMLPSIARCESDYNPEHGYWTGPCWPPTTYMTIMGLRANGYEKEAEEVAKRWYNGVYEIYLRTGTLWENWSPEQCGEQKGWAGKDFCGWSALAPIALPQDFGWMTSGVK